MLSNDPINDVIIAPAMGEFWRFISSHQENGDLPDYKAINLMQIAHLVPDIWVYDLRGDTELDRLYTAFCGSRIEEYWGHRFQGTNDMDFLGQNHVFDEIMAHRIHCIRNKKAGYTKRFIEYRESYKLTKFVKAECMLFPCSTNGDTVDWSIGYATYVNTNDEGEDVYLEF